MNLPLKDRISALLHSGKSVSIFSRLKRKIISSVLNFIQAEEPLESLYQCPDLFHIYRELAKHPDLIREPGGWRYKDRFYPDYLTVGGASHAVFRTALQYCKGTGLDIGAGYWPLPGAEAVDISRGVGCGKLISDHADESLDFIFSSHCLEHIINWKEALLKWTRKLKKGGILFLYLPHPKCEIWLPGSPMVGDGHKWIPNITVVEKELIKLDMEIISRDEGPDAMYSFYICGKKQVDG